MAAPSKSFTVQPDTQVDANSPLDETLMTEQRDNDIHLEEWMGKNYTAAVDHDHDGTNSKGVVGVAANSLTGAMVKYLNSDGLSQFALYVSEKSSELSHVGITDTTSYISWLATEIFVPANANNLKIHFYLQRTGAANSAYAKATMAGVTDSDEAVEGGPAGVFVEKEITLDVSSYSGWQLLDWQMRCTSGAGGASAEAKQVHCRFI